jgi:competence protein ComER
MKIGMIGTGNMGSILIRSFIDSGAVQPSRLVISNRTRAKAEKIQTDFPEVRVVDEPKQVAEEAAIVFICVKPLDIYPLLAKIKDKLGNEKLLVSITSPVAVQELETVVDCGVARAVPSITNRAHSGASLISFGESCNKTQREDLLELYGKISNPYFIEENITRVASDIASCGPAFFSYVAQQFVEGAVSETDISYEQATILTSEMLIGLGKLLEKEIFTLPALQEKVCVKGGVTGEGITILERETGDMFRHLFQRTHEKYRDDREKVERQFKY